MSRVIAWFLATSAIFSAGGEALFADVTEAQKRYYIGLAKSWIDRNAGGVAASFDSRVMLDLGPYCRRGQYKKRQATAVLATHLGRHVAPDPRRTKIIKMAPGYMILRHHYRDLPTGQHRQQNLWFIVRSEGGRHLLTEIHP